MSNREQMPQEQFQRVKQNQNSSPESSQEDRESRVTSYTRNDAIRNQTHEAGKDLQRARYSQSGCCQVCHRSSQWSIRQWKCRRKPNTAEVTVTRRTKSIWHEKQPDCDSVEQHPSSSKSRHTGSIEAEAHKRSTSMSQTVSASIPKCDFEAKDFSKSEVELVDVLGTLQT